MTQIRDYSHFGPEQPDIDDLIFGYEQPHSEK